jgi:hypothetical protein
MRKNRQKRTKKEEGKGALRDGPGPVYAGQLPRDPQRTPKVINHGWRNISIETDLSPADRHSQFGR